jgi:hypothetical protein
MPSSNNVETMFVQQFCLFSSVELSFLSAFDFVSSATSVSERFCFTGVRIRLDTWTIDTIEKRCW